MSECSQENVQFLHISALVQQRESSTVASVSTRNQATSTEITIKQVNVPRSESTISVGQERVSSTESITSTAPGRVPSPKSTVSLSTEQEHVSNSESISTEPTVSTEQDHVTNTGPVMLIDKDYVTSTKGMFLIVTAQDHVTSIEPMILTEDRVASTESESTELPKHYPDYQVTRTEFTTANPQNRAASINLTRNGSASNYKLWRVNDSVLMSQPLKKKTKWNLPPPVEAEGSVGIGIVGILSVSFVIGVIVALDLDTLYRHFCKMRRNVIYFIKVMKKIHTKKIKTMS